MSIKTSKTLLHSVIVASLSIAVSGCFHDDDDDEPMTPPPPPPPVEVTYQVTVTNLTSAQPLSPVAVALHQQGQFWQVGEAASTELEVMAEGGDNSQLLGLSWVEAMASGAAPIGPGDSETITVTIEDVTDAKLSVATMLVNTNDAFSGLNSFSTANLEVGDSWSAVLPAYDAGTEANTEAAGSIPGPADGGTGYDEARDDVDFVGMHSGVVSASDNLPDSVLMAEHCFDNPVMRVSITRMQ